MNGKCIMFVILAWAGVGCSGRLHAGDTAPEAPSARTVVDVPLRDGVRLKADLFLPAPIDELTGDARVPVILARTPYGRNTEGTLYGAYFAKHNYAFVAQDVRGRLDSEGEWTPFRNEEQDGVDSIDWLVRQPWCNGRVAMFGASYGAMCAWYAAASGHPNLHAVIAMVNVADPDQFMPFEGGAFHIGFAGWARLLEILEMPNGAAAPLLFDWNSAARVRPLSNIDGFFNTTHAYVDEVLSHPLSDRAYWQPLGYVDRLANARVAGLHITGWFDVHRRGTFSTFDAMRNRAATGSARESQYLIAGPWAHLGVNRSTRMGNVDFGRDSTIDLDANMLAFLDRHLKPGESTKPPPPNVRVFIPGPNHWIEGTRWPLSGSVETEFTLESEGRAGLRTDNGFADGGGRRPGRCGV